MRGSIAIAIATTPDPGCSRGAERAGRRSEGPRALEALTQPGPRPTLRSTLPAGDQPFGVSGAKLREFDASARDYRRALLQEVTHGDVPD